MKTSTSQINDLEERLVDFSVLCIKTAEQLKNTFAGRYFKNQLIRAGSSPALNYAEGRFAESRKDFIHKSKIVLKELYESRVCMRIILKSACFTKKDYLEMAVKESNELIAIFVASINTATKNLSKAEQRKHA